MEVTALAKKQSKSAPLTPVEKLDKLCQKHGFTTLTRCDFGRGQHGFHFYTNGACIELIERPDGGYRVRCEVHPYILNEIKEAGFPIPARKKRKIVRFGGPM